MQGVSLLHSSTGVRSVPSPGKGEEGTGSSVCVTSLCVVSLSSPWAMQVAEPGFHGFAREVIAGSSVMALLQAPLIS